MRVLHVNGLVDYDIAKELNNKEDNILPIRY